MHTYTYIYIHIHTYTYIYIHIHTYTYIYIHIHTYTYIYIHIHTYTYIYIHIHTYIHTYIHTFPHAFLHTFVHTNIQTCAHTYHIWYSFASYFCFPRGFWFWQKISPLPSHRKLFRARQWTLIPITSTLQPGNWMANLSSWEVPKVSVYYMVNPMIFLVVEDRSCWWFVRFRDHDGKRKRPNCWCFHMFVIYTPILEKKWSNLTHIFQMAWFNHHLEIVVVYL